MLAVLVVISLLAAGTPGAAPPPAAVPAVPDEPGAFFLPEAPTIQAVAADLDADGARELVRLVRRAGGAIDAEAWGERVGTWSLLGSVEAIPAAMVPGRVSYTGAPVRLLVRRADGSERVTIARQPDFREPDLVECCLLLDDLHLDSAGLQLIEVANPELSVDAVLVLDLDGDGTDELLTSRSLPPLADVSFPTEASVLRWSSGRFADPVRTELPIGSGDSPFVLGDTDGRAGDEAAIIVSRGRGTLHRVSLGPGDGLVVEDSDRAALGAVALASGVRRGIAMAIRDGVILAEWPSGVPLSSPATIRLDEPRIVGAVAQGAEPVVVVRAGGALPIQTIRWSGAGIQVAGIAPSAAATSLVGAPVGPYTGMLPGGDRDGAPLAIVEGRHVGSTVAEGALLAGTEPIGLVGPGRRWVALLHAPPRIAQPGARGGRLDPPVAEAGSNVSIAPASSLGVPETEAGALDPQTDGVEPLTDGTVATDVGGLTAEVVGPPGARVYSDGAASGGPTSVATMPAAGALKLRIAPAASDGPGGVRRVGLVVVTAAGHAYATVWHVRVFDGPPSVRASAFTPIGSAAVVISGSVDPGTSVTVDGVAAEVDARGTFAGRVSLPPWPTDVRVTAIDAVGNAATIGVSGVGWFDYRSLPGIPIAVVVVGLIGTVLYLRVPTPPPRAPAREGDATFEEVEPD